MKAKMLGEGGSAATAREIYLHMFQEAGDDQVKEMARRHLMRLNSLDERRLAEGPGHLPITGGTLSLIVERY